jgi:hypothetical protein
VTKIGRMPQQSDKFFVDFDMLTTIASLLSMFCLGWNLNLWNTDPPIVGQMRRIRFLLFGICCRGCDCNDCCDCYLEFVV